jgi:hypothetical protein
VRGAAPQRERTAVGKMAGSWECSAVSERVGESAQPNDVGGPSDEPNVDSFESMHSSDKQWERDEGAYWSAQTGGQQGTPPESLTSLGGDGTDAVSRTHAPIDLDETLAQCGGFLMSSKWTVQGSRSPAAHLFGSSAPSDPDTSPESETSSETSSAPWYQDSAVGWDNIDLRDPQSIMSVPISIQHFENSVHQAVDIACGGGGGGGRGENSSRRSRSPDHSNVSIIQGPRTEKDVVARLMKAVKQKKSFRGTITNYDALQRPLSNTLEVTPVQVLSVDKFYFLTTSHITHHPAPTRHRRHRKQLIHPNSRSAAIGAAAAAAVAAADADAGAPAVPSVPSPTVFFPVRPQAEAAAREALRKEAVARYLSKRRKRDAGSKRPVRKPGQKLRERRQKYASRQSIAHHRPRVWGRFVKTSARIEAEEGTMSKKVSANSDM